MIGRNYRENGMIKVIIRHARDLLFRAYKYVKLIGLPNVLRLILFQLAKNFSASFQAGRHTSKLASQREAKPLTVECERGAGQAKKEI